MARRGRKKKTRAQRIASNSRQKDVSNNGKGAKIVTLGKLTRKPPEGLTTKQKKVWKDFMEDCQGNRSVRIPDKAEIIHYCEMIVRATELKKTIDKEGELLEKVSDKGNIIFYKHPAGEILFSLNRELRSIRRDFGMSPIGRKKIDIEISEIEQVKSSMEPEDKGNPDQYGFTERDFEKLMDG